MAQASHGGRIASIHNPSSLQFFYSSSLHRTSQNVLAFFRLDERTTTRRSAGPLEQYRILQKSLF